MRLLVRAAFMTALSASETSIWSGGARTESPGSETNSLSSLGVQAAWWRKHEHMCYTAVGRKKGGDSCLRVLIRNLVTGHTPSTQ